MNNEQFRRLAFAGSADKKAESPATANAARTPMLGSRQKASIPMTPRPGGTGGTGGSGSRVAFAKQMAERFGAGGAKPAAKPKRSAPKGSKFAAGYVDRAKLRAEMGEDATREIKGLDFFLQTRGSGGDTTDDVTEEKVEDEVDTETVTETVADDEADEFDRLEKAEVQRVAKAETRKKGQFSTAPVAPVAGQKRSRDQILAEMKAARVAAQAAKKKVQEQALGARFKKIGTTAVPGSSRIERDGRGREVLVLVDEDGHEKRKVRRPPSDDADKQVEAEKMKTTEVLGMEVPEFYRKKLAAEAAEAEKEANKEVNIFDDAGSDYDPLAGINDTDTEDESVVDTTGENREKRDDDASDSSTSSRDTRDSHYSTDSANSRVARRRDARRRSESYDSQDARGSYDDRKSDSRSRSRSRLRDHSELKAPRPNYFGSGTLLSEQTRPDASADEAVRAVMRRARQMHAASEAAARTEAQTKEAEREARLKALLATSERDADDMDLGFSVTRGGVEEDEGDGDGATRVRLHTWKGGKGGKAGKTDNDNDDDDDDGRDAPKAKRKRGPKKRAGDPNSVADVLRVMDGRKK